MFAPLHRDDAWVLEWNKGRFGSIGILIKLHY